MRSTQTRRRSGGKPTGTRRTLRAKPPTLPRAARRGGAASPRKSRATREVRDTATVSASAAYCGHMSVCSGCMRRRGRGGEAGAGAWTLCRSSAGAVMQGYGLR